MIIIVSKTRKSRDLEGGLGKVYRQALGLIGRGLIRRTAVGRIKMVSAPLTEMSLLAAASSAEALSREANC